MSRKRVKEVTRKELENLMKGFSRKDWAGVLEVSSSAMEKWFSRGRVPEDKLTEIQELALMVKSTPDGLPLKEVRDYHSGNSIEKQFRSKVHMPVRKKDMPLGGLPREDLVEIRKEINKVLRFSKTTIHNLRVKDAHKRFPREYVEACFGSNGTIRYIDKKCACMGKLIGHYNPFTHECKNGKVSSRK
ncbi:MAG: hypothetical protein ACPGJV_09640 [Bacteriovoracaceae bacterium]